MKGGAIFPEYSTNIGEVAIKKVTKRVVPLKSIFLKRKKVNGMQDTLMKNIINFKENGCPLVKKKGIASVISQRGFARDTFPPNAYPTVGSM